MKHALTPAADPLAVLQHTPAERQSGTTDSEEVTEHPSHTCKIVTHLQSGLRRNAHNAATEVLRFFVEWALVNAVAHAVDPFEQKFCCVGELEELGGFENLEAAAVRVLTHAGEGGMDEEEEHNEEDACRRECGVHGQIEGLRCSFKSANCPISFVFVFFERPALPAQHCHSQCTNTDHGPNAQR